MTPASAFLNSVGVNVHMYLRAGPYASLPLIESLLSQLGIVHLRDGAFFSTVINRDTYYYQSFRALAALGYKFSLVCFGPQNPFFFTPPDQVANIFNWCNGAVEQFEGDNETYLCAAPTTKGPPLAAWVQGQLYHAVRGGAATAGLPVLGPSYVKGGCRLSNGQDLRLPIPGLCSKVNMHPYPGMEQPETTSQNGGLLNNLAWARIAQGQTPPQPAQSTEYGYHTALQDPSTFLPVSEPIKTRYLPRALLYPFAQGIERTYLYQLIDDAPNDPTKKETNFGLADFNGNPKPSFKAVANLLALCKTGNPPAGGPARSFTLSGDQTNVQTVLLGRADGSSVLFVWLGVSGWNPGTKTALAPVTRESVLALNSPVPNSVVGHLFNDDGTQTIAPLVPVPGGYWVTISDQLTAIEIA